MAVDFILDPPSFAIPTMGSLRATWRHIPNVQVRDSICQEHQYFLFHSFLLDSLRYTKHGHAKSPPYASRINWTVRAGAVKAAILLCGSIAEAALRAHAEKRGYALATDPRNRMFGNVLKAWKVGSMPRGEVAAIWTKLDNLKDARNNIHLFKAANDPNADYRQVLTAEEELLTQATDILSTLAGIQSS